MSFKDVFNKEICLKSPMEVGVCTLGTSVIKVLFMLQTVIPLLQGPAKVLLKPSGPRDLSLVRCLISHIINFSI